MGLYEEGGWRDGVWGEGDKGGLGIGDKRGRGGMVGEYVIVSGRVSNRNLISKVWEV